MDKTHFNYEKAFDFLDENGVQHVTPFEIETELSHKIRECSWEVLTSDTQSFTPGQRVAPAPRKKEFKLMPSPLSAGKWKQRSSTQSSPAQSMPDKPCLRTSLTMNLQEKDEPEEAKKAQSPCRIEKEQSKVSSSFF